MKKSVSTFLIALLFATTWCNDLAAAPTHLDESLFGGKVVSNYILRLTDASDVAEWQPVDVRLKALNKVEVVYPALSIIKQAGASGALPSGIVEIKSVHIELGGHTSYFRPICGVRVTIVPLGTPNRPAGKPLYATSSFVGSFASDFLASDKAKQAISAAILDCLSKLQPEN